MIGGGSRCPSRDEVNRMRLHIWENRDERKEITENQTFKRYYKEIERKDNVDAERRLKSKV
jgi:hypothetical protein